jgi:hypothetical protein
MKRRRLREIGQTESAQEFHWQDVHLALKDWKVWIFCFAQFGSDTMLYGFSTFLPTIIEGINPKWSSAVVQLLTMPCYTLGAITYLIAARISDRQQRRGIPTVVLGVVSVIGYAMLMSDSGSGVHYAGCFLVAMGLYVVVGIPLAWLPSNNPRYGKRTTASGMQLTIGNTSGIMASFVGFAARFPSFSISLISSSSIRQMGDHGISKVMLLLSASLLLVLSSLGLCLCTSVRSINEGQKGKRMRKLQG